MSVKRSERTAILRAFRRKLLKRFPVRKPVKVFYSRKCEDDTAEGEAHNRGSHFDVRIKPDMSFDDVVLTLCHEWAHIHLWPQDECFDHFIRFYETKIAILRFARDEGIYH